jgi:hypothetical protein
MAAPRLGEDVVPVSQVILPAGLFPGVESCHQLAGGVDHSEIHISFQQVVGDGQAVKVNTGDGPLATKSMTDPD